jgi:predicted DNA-binding protein (UPF0278 family)
LQVEICARLRFDLSAHTCRNVYEELIVFGHEEVASTSIASIAAPYQKLLPERYKVADNHVCSF